jgi:hypothetical protein
MILRKNPPRDEGDKVQLFGSFTMAIFWLLSFRANRDTLLPHGWQIATEIYSEKQK